MMNLKLDLDPEVTRAYGFGLLILVVSLAVGALAGWLLGPLPG